MWIGEFLLTTGIKRESFLFTLPHLFGDVNYWYTSIYSIYFRFGWGGTQCWGGFDIVWEQNVGKKTQVLSLLVYQPYVFKIYEHIVIHNLTLAVRLICKKAWSLLNAAFFTLYVTLTNNGKKNCGPGGGVPGDLSQKMPSPRGGALNTTGHPDSEVIQMS